MFQFREWLAGVLLNGESIQEASPELPPQERAEVVEQLQAAFARRALDVAGPPIRFDPPAALAAAELLAQACWILTSADEPDNLATIPTREPATPSTHLSIDVTLRFLPAVYRRSRARSATGPRTLELDKVLRAWPLSGVLADLDGEPATNLGFGGHAGLQMLYAERFATTGRIGWMPQGGTEREWVERIYRERNKLLPASPKETPRG